MLDASLKARPLVEYVEEQILSGQYPGGSRIPSTRELARRFQISQNTALSGVNYLVERGMLVKKARSGVLVAENWYRGGGVAGSGRDGGYELAVFGVMRNTELYGACICGIKEYAEIHGIRLRLAMLPFFSVDEMVLARLARGVDGVLLLSEYDTTMERMPLPMPTVGILMHSMYDETISIVDLDPFAAARAAAAYFREAGIRKVHGIGAPRPVYDTRLSIFESLWKAEGGEYFSGGAEYQGGYLKVQFDFRRDHGYLFASDSLLDAASKGYAREHDGRPLAADITVLGIDGKNLQVPEMHHFPSIAVNWRNIGRIAIAECISRIQNPESEPKRIYVAGRIVHPPG